MVENNPLISIIVPVYNIAGRIPALIESLKCQSYENLEIVIYDDASADTNKGAYFKALSLEQRFASVKVLRGEINRGVSFARNRGIEAAAGKYLIFIDGDDLVDENIILKLYNALASAGADYASCGYKTLELMSGLERGHPLRVPAGLTKDQVLAGRIRNEYEICHWATLFCKEFIVNNNLRFVEGRSAGEDMEFIYKFVCHGQGTFVPDCLYTYVYHDGMGSRKNVIDKQKKYSRYSDHTYAQIRQTAYVVKNAPGKLSLRLARDMLWPSACQRILSLCAMRGDGERYEKLLRAPRMRKNLLSAWRSLFYKPEVFLRSCFALFTPGLYWKKYASYL